MIEITKLKNNPNNPRTIKKEQLEKLKRSIQSFPEMMEKRPMVCVTDTDGKIFPLGGNMRLKAIKELGFKEIKKEWITLADEWTEEQRREFVIKDNVSFGDWNLDIISKEGKAAKRDCLLLSGHYHNHRKIGRMVSKNGWDIIRKKFMDDKIYPLKLDVRQAVLF